MSTIAAGTTSGTALVNTGDTTGQLVLQTNGTTTAVTIGTNQVVTLAQPLPVASGGTGATSLSGITVGTATNATTATNLAGGGAGQVPYNSASGTTAFLAAGTSGQVLQSNGVSAPSWGTVGVAAGGTGVTSLTANNVLLGNGTSAVQFVAPSTNGNVLTSNGTTWVSSAPAGGGSWIFLSNVAASGATTVDIETTFDSTYDMYVIVAPAFTLSGTPSNGVLKCRLKIGGSYPAVSGYMYASTTTVSTTYAGLASTNNDAIYFTNQLSDSTSFPNASMSLVIYVPRPSVTTRNKMIFWTGGHTFSNNPNQMNGMGWYSSSNAALTGVRILFDSGATFTGNFRLYGIKNS